MNTVMPKTKEEKLALLEETINFYNSNNRCISGTVCHYYLPNKAGCAVGRLIEDKEICKKLDTQIKMTTSIGNDTNFAMLPPEVQAWGQEFLYELQGLHDCSAYWKPEGMTASGLERADEVRARIEAGEL